MFLVGGVEAISGLIPSALVTPVLAVLGGLAAYFRANPAVDFDE